MKTLKFKFFIDNLFTAWSFSFEAARIISQKGKGEKINKKSRKT